MVNLGFCVSAGFIGCCTSDCQIISPTQGSCYCDALCYEFGDCCEDIIGIGCFTQNGMSANELNVFRT